MTADRARMVKPNTRTKRKFVRHSGIFQERNSMIGSSWTEFKPEGQLASVHFASLATRNRTRASGPRGHHRKRRRKDAKSKERSVRRPRTAGFFQCEKDPVKAAAVDKSVLMFLSRDIPLPDDTQAIEREQIVDGLDVLRVVADHARETAGGEDFGFVAQLLQQAFDDSVDQAEIAEKQARLNAGDGVGADDLRGHADIHQRKAGGVLEQRLGGDADAGRD